MQLWRRRTPWRPVQRYIRTVARRMATQVKVNEDLSEDQKKVLSGESLAVFPKAFVESLFPVAPRSPEAEDDEREEEEPAGPPEEGGEGEQPAETGKAG